MQEHNSSKVLEISV